MGNDDCKVWFITGANKGLGAAIAREALAGGCKVVAAARNPDSVRQALGESANLLCVKLDLTDEGQIKAAAGRALDVFGRIDVLVNNAGYGLLGYFEEMSEAQIRRQIETNLFGTMSLTRAVLPGMRERGAGWVVTVTSTSGIRAVAGGSVYSASKFALEGWVEGMRIDCEPLGVKWMLVEPGAFRTDFLNEKASTEFPDMNVAGYDGLRDAIHNVFAANNGKQPGDPAKLARVLMTALGAETPPLRLVAGKGAVDGIAKYYAERLREFEAWKDVSASTDFD